MTNAVARNGEKVVKHNVMFTGLPQSVLDGLTDEEKRALGLM